MRALARGARMVRDDGRRRGSRAPWRAAVARRGAYPRSLTHRRGRPALAEDSAGLRRLPSCFLGMLHLMLLPLGCLLALVCQDAASLAWLVAQLTHSVVPFRTALASWLEDWAWQQWEGSRAPRSSPRPVSEVSATAASADLGLPFIVRGLLNGSAVLANGTSWLTAF